MGFNRIVLIEQRLRALIAYAVIPIEMPRIEVAAINLKPMLALRLGRAK